MNQVRKSYSIAKSKNLARFDALLQNNEKSTILFVSKYGSIKQGFLSEYINDRIKDETLVMNFMYFSELYNDGKPFDIGTHFEKQLEIFKSDSIDVEDDEEIVEEEVGKNSKILESIMLFVDGLIIIFLNYFILRNINIGDYIAFLDEKDFIFNIAIYLIGVLLIVFGIITFVSGRKSNVKKSGKKKKKPAESNEQVVVHTITQRKEDNENLYQTQSLDFRQLLGKPGNNYEFDLSVTDKKYFVLYGLDEYVHFVKTNSEDSKEMIKQVSDFMIKVYSTFKKYSDRKLIFVWKDRVFINQDLTLLIFDEIFTLYGDFDEIELHNHTISVLESYGFDVSEQIREEIYSKVSYLSDIDNLVKEMNAVSQFIEVEISVDKLAYIQFLKMFDVHKIEALQKYFSENDKMVDVKHFTISKNEFELYFIGTPKIVDISSDTVDTEEKFLDYADAIIDSSINHVEYKIKDDFEKLTQFIESVPEADLHLFVNIDILDYLLNHDDSKLLGEKIIFSLLNLNNEKFREKFKSLFNALAKSSLSDGRDYTKIVETIVMIMLAVERRKELACMYSVPRTYIKENRKTAIMMIRHINKKVDTFTVFNNNSTMIDQLLNEAIKK